MSSSLVDRDLYKGGSFHHSIDACRPRLVFTHASRDRVSGEHIGLRVALDAPR